MSKIIKRKAVLIDCDIDFGLGNGIIYEDEITVKDNSPLSVAGILDANKKLLEKLIKIEMEEK